MPDKDRKARREERRLRRKIGRETKYVCEGNKCRPKGVGAVDKPPGKRMTPKIDKPKIKERHGYRYEEEEIKSKKPDVVDETKEKKKKITGTTTYDIKEYDKPVKKEDKDKSIIEKGGKYGVKRAVITETPTKEEDVEVAPKKPPLFVDPQTGEELPRAKGGVPYGRYKQTHVGTKKQKEAIVPEKKKEDDKEIVTSKRTRQFKTERGGAEYLKRERDETFVGDSPSIKYTTYKKPSKKDVEEGALHGDVKRSYTIDKAKKAEIDREMSKRKREKLSRKPIEKTYRYYKRKGA